MNLLGEISINVTDTIDTNNNSLVELDHQRTVLGSINGMVCIIEFAFNFLS
jgi:hypothetical protein